MTTPLAADVVRLSLSRERIWAIFDDVDALARVLPGCEHLAELEPRVYRGIVATRLQFLTVRAEVTARILDAAPPSHLRLDIAGRPLSLAGGFSATIPIDLEDANDPDGGGTVVTYRVDFTTSGRLASFGAPILRDSLRRQIAELVRNLEREVGPDLGATSGASIR
jgi:carbon monoxide dehydrogenase subunit G